ncbi:MAG: trypsin-like peptidase domain-containing protein [Planctomycetota bacterium]|nr:trypsin-like peptidase domain-containing protein [Planctomycetota bacterium]
MSQYTVIQRLLFSPLVALAIVSCGNPASAQVQDPLAYAQARIVKIFGAGGMKNLHAYSTGFLVSPEGHVATIWSHVLDSDEVTAVLSDGRKFTANVVGAEPRMDVAVIKLTGDVKDLPFFELNDAKSASVGARILGLSNMFKVATGDEPVSVLHGVIAAKTKLTTRRGAFQTPYEGDVYIVDAITNNPGAGGGVLMSLDGKLLGMIGKELRNAASNTWVNYALPMTDLRDVIDQIIAGVYVAEKKPDEELAPERYNSLDFGVVMVPDVLFRTPAFVDRILPGSLAAKSGLVSGDLVLFVNGELVQSCRNLQSELGKLEGQDDLKLVVRRGKNLIEFEMRVPNKAN